MATTTIEKPAYWMRAGTSVAALLAFALMLLLLVLMHRQVAPPIHYGSDDTYLNLAVARTLHEHRILGLGTTSPTPATTDTLWQVVLSIAYRYLDRPATLPLVAGALLGMLVVSTTRGLGRHWIGFSTAGWAAVLIAVSSGLPLDVMRGESGALSLFLISMLLLRYVQGGPRDQWPLPLGTAWWAGLAALVHIELLVIWLAIALHAVVTGPFRQGRGHGVVFPLLRLLSGLIILGLVLSPALSWNNSVLSVPWPRMPDAPMALDAWGAAGAGTTTVETAGQVIGSCYARALSVPLLHGIVPILILGIGLIFSVVDAIRDRQRLVGTVGVALLLVPLFYAVIYPYVGWKAAASVFGALQTAWAVLMVLGVWRIMTGVCRLLHRALQRELAWLSPAWASAVVLTLLSLTGVLRTMGVARAEFQSLPDLIAVRGRVAAELGETTPGEKVASDQVGWLAFTRPGSYLDLSGRVTPVMLAFRSDQAGWQLEEAASYLRDQGVNRLVTWKESYSYAETALGVTADTPCPRVAHLP